MRHGIKDPRLTRWLEAEARRDEGTAEEALLGLVATLPRATAPAGFAARVMARAAAPVPWPLERAALVLLLLCGAALAATPLWLGALWARFEPQALVATLDGVVARLGLLIGELVPLGIAFAKVARWLSLAGATPEVLGFLAFCALLAATAGRLLVSLLDERSAGHAQV
jgi:hypothetical protein